MVADRAVPDPFPRIREGKSLVRTAMHSLRPLFPLLITAGVLLAGNGLQGTLVTLRGSAEPSRPWPRSQPVRRSPWSW
jgi:hypothetical protein